MVCGDAALLAGRLIACESAHDDLIAQPPRLSLTRMSDSTNTEDAAKSALVVFSGGQDSATCLAWALAHYERVETVGFAYGQRHAVELDQRAKVVAELPSALVRGRTIVDTMLDCPTIPQLGDTAMTSDTEITMAANGLPTTFVPARNLLFLTFTGALAYRRGIKHIVTGVCETDYSGYPDCRDDTIKALQVALNLGMACRLVLHTPLMFVDKAATWKMAHELGGDELVQCILEHSHSCYVGDRTKRNEYGYGCDSCPACELRANGWKGWVAMRQSTCATSAAER